MNAGSLYAARDQPEKEREGEGGERERENDLTCGDRASSSEAQ